LARSPSASSACAAASSCQVAEAEVALAARDLTRLAQKVAAMTRNGCRMRKAEINKLISSDSRRLEEINRQLQHLRIHAHRKTRKRSASPKSPAVRGPIWLKLANRIDPSPYAKPTGWLFAKTAAHPVPSSQSRFKLKTGKVKISGPVSAPFS
jgi:hypothetical protein